MKVTSSGGGGASIGVKVAECSFTTDGAGHITMVGSHPGITSLSLPIGVTPKHVTVTFSSAFADALYSVAASVWSIADDSTRAVGTPNGADGADGRAASTCIIWFGDLTAGAGETDLGGTALHGTITAIGA